jgi:hypothetical protein
MRIAPALKDGGYYAASLRDACPLQEHVLNVLPENGQSRVKKLFRFSSILWPVIPAKAGIHVRFKPE